MLTERDRWAMYVCACINVPNTKIQDAIMRADKILVEEKHRYPHDDTSIVHDAAGKPVDVRPRAPFSEDDEEDA